jgi:hypothetical protein
MMKSDSTVENSDETNNKNVGTPPVDNQTVETQPATETTTTSPSEPDPVIVDRPEQQPDQTEPNGQEDQSQRRGTYVDLTASTADDTDKPVDLTATLVHYVLDDSFRYGEERPGIIVRTVKDADDIERSQITVFTDADNDYDRSATHTGFTGIMLRSGVRYDANKSPNSWHNAGE